MTERTKRTSLSNGVRLSDKLAIFYGIVTIIIVLPLMRMQIIKEPKIVPDLIRNIGADSPYLPLLILLFLTLVVDLGVIMNFAYSDTGFVKLMKKKRDEYRLSDLENRQRWGSIIALGVILLANLVYLNILIIVVLSILVMVALVSVIAD